MSMPLNPIRKEYDEAETHLDDDAALLLDSKGTPARPRQGSVHFDFNTINLSLSGVESGEGAANGRRTGDDQMSLVGGIALVVGLQLGSGIFASPGVVLRETGSVGSALLIWGIAGALNWAGASSFAELGTSIPLNGGAQAYLQTVFGELASSMFSATAIGVLKPSSQAIISIIGAEYVFRLFVDTPVVGSNIAIKLVAAFSVFLVAGLQAWSSKGGTQVQVVLTSFKVLSVVAIFAGGLSRVTKTAIPFSFNGSSQAPASYALALFASSWCFDGWDQANYIAKDVAPGKLPSIIRYSMATVTTLFLLANISFFLVVPFTLATTNPIGLQFGRELFGSVGAALMSVIVAVSCLGALNSSLYTSSRLVVAAAEQDFLPDLFSRYNERRNTPVNGILLSVALTCFFIAIGDFTRLTLFYGVTAWTFNLACVVGLLLLRVQQPNLKRPYRTILATPIIFCSTALFLLTLSTFTKPLESLAALGLIAISSLPYFITGRYLKNPMPPSKPLTEELEEMDELPPPT